MCTQVLRNVLPTSNCIFSELIKVKTPTRAQLQKLRPKPTYFLPQHTLANMYPKYLSRLKCMKIYKTVKISALATSVSVINIAFSAVLMNG